MLIIISIKELLKYVDIEITEADMYSYTRIRENIEEELMNHNWKKIWMY